MQVVVRHNASKSFIVESISNDVKTYKLIFSFLLPKDVSILTPEQAFNLIDSFNMERSEFTLIPYKHAMSQVWVK